MFRLRRQARCQDACPTLAREPAYPAGSDESFRLSFRRKAVPRTLPFWGAAGAADCAAARAGTSGAATAAILWDGVAVFVEHSRVFVVVIGESSAVPVEICAAINQHENRRKKHERTDVSQVFHKGTVTGSGLGGNGVLDGGGRGGME